MFTVEKWQFKGEVVQLCILQIHHMNGDCLTE